MIEMARSRRRITLIDDDAEFRELMRDIFAARHDVSLLSGEQLTTDDIVGSRPDLIIVDLRLHESDLDGWDVLRLARSRDRLQAVPIVVCSAAAEELESRSDALLDLGNLAYLSKPFGLEAVEEIVSQGLAAGFMNGHAGLRT
jgi:CheY-like chemotaxis protein